MNHPYNAYFAIMNDPTVNGGVTKLTAAHPYNEHFPESTAIHKRNIASESPEKGTILAEHFAAVLENRAKIIL